jgi:hypothetical protein
MMASGRGDLDVVPLDIRAVAAVVHVSRARAARVLADKLASALTLVALGLIGDGARGAGSLGHAAAALTRSGLIRVI